MAEEPQIADQERRYRGAAETYGPAIARLARGYEADAELARDLVQDVHVALWRSFAAFDGRCSERTWVYRVAHNAAADHIRARKRLRAETLVGIEEAGEFAAGDDPETATHERHLLARLTRLIHRLKPADRQVMLLYLEDLTAAEIGEITGLSAGAVSVRIHRIKALLADRFTQKEPA
ncbi:MAG: sigma-70 family RNA polymerase sigma factor [Sphingomonas sp.]|nr:sigma-70 family RNA polymerase sigma factor [Sphingomonas sp.]